MEPQDSEKHNEGSGFRKRSISSILKAPRKSIILHDLEQQEDEVESTKPVEKRNSRRVSFAPANDVLLFANDVKNASPVRNPLQELTAPATRNRAQAEQKAEKSQQISGIENLLKAPLHVPLQASTVSPDVWKEIGEKTVVFSADDATMDMTHSHTINIGGDADLLGETYMSEKTGEAGLPDLSVNMMTSRSTDLSGVKGSFSATVSSLDPGFEDFLASLSQPSGSSVGTAFAGPPKQSSGSGVGLSKAQRAEAVKENKLPGLENSTKKISEGFGGSTPCQMVDMSVDEFLTEPRMGHSLGGCDKNNPFQCLFPTLDMFAEKGASRQTTRTSDPRDMNSASPLHQNPSVSSAAKGQKTGTLPVGKDFMDITRSHTVHPSSGFSAKLLTTEPSPKGVQARDPSLCIREGSWSVNRSAAEPCGVDPEGDVSMEMTEVQTGHIEGLSDSQDPLQFLLSSREEVFPLSRNPDKADAASGPGNMKGSSSIQGVETSLETSIKSSQRCQAMFGSNHEEKVVQFTADDDCMDITQSYTANINCKSSLQLFSNVDLKRHEDKTVRFSQTDAAMDQTKSHTVASGVQQTFLQHTKGLPSDGEKTVRFTANDAAMDVTKSHTVNISSGFQPSYLQKTETLPLNGEKTVRFTANDAAMDVTKSHTVASGVQQTFLQHTKGLPSDGEKTVRFTANDAAMDVTKSHTVNISSGFQPLYLQKTETLSSDGEKTVSFTANDAAMDVTKSHTVNIASGFQPSYLQKTETLPSNGEKTVRFTANDAVMDVTKSHTVNISSGFQPSYLQKTETLPSDGEKTVRFTANDAAMDVTKSHTVNIASGFQPSYLQKAETLPSNGEKTVRFTANDAAMDVTKSHTVNIASGFQPLYLQKTETLPSDGEKTVTFTANDAVMDVTKSHTVNISSGFQPSYLQKTETLPSNGEKTVRFTANDAAMDVTKSHTVNIDADLGLIQLQSLGSLPTNLDKTQMYNTKEPEMDLTKGHAINMATYLKVLSQPVLDVFEEEKAIGSTPINEAGNGMQSCSEVIPATFEQKCHQSKDVSPSKGDKTVRFTLSDAAMDVTQSHTVFIDADVDAIQQQDVDFLPLKVKPDKTTMDVAKDPIAAHSHVLPRLAHSDKAQSFRSVTTDEAVNRTKSSTANIFTRLEPVSVPSMDALLTRGKKTPFSATAMDTTQTLSANTDSNLVIQPDTALSLRACKPELCLEQELNKYISQTSVPVDNRNPLQTLQPNSCPSDQKLEPFPDKTTANCSQIFEGLDICADQTCSTEGKSSAELQTQSVFASQDQMVTSESKEMLRSCHTTLSNPPDCVTSTQAALMKEPEPATLGSVVSLEQESPAVDQHRMLNSRRSRRKSLADLQTKVRRLSHLINADPDVVGMEMCTAPLPQTDYDDCKNASNESASAPPSDMQLQGDSNAEAKTLDLCHQEGQQPVATATADATPFRCKTKQLISRLSVGGFKPKLPRRSCPEDPNRGASAEEPTKSVVGINEPNDPEEEISNIYDEELDSCEDMSETIDTRSPERIVEKRSPPEELMVHPPNDVFTEEHQGQKRPLMEDEGERENEKRLRASSESELMSEVGEQDVSGTRTATQSSDSSSRCEAAFDSTVKNSLFESQLEDSSCDVLKKLDDGTITVSEFLRLFNIDFVIHNPRQSFLPSRLLSETEVTTMDCLKNRHISRPKQKVYEADIQNLSQEVQRLHVRMWDLQKPLRRVNARLWEEIRRFSEKELKAFGAQLKARSNFYRKQSKVQSHHMKEVLYTNLIGAYREEQQAIREKLEQDDQLIRSLDSCIAEVEAELAKVEEDGSEDEPSLKSLREDGEKVTKVLADRKRQIAELEAQKEEDLNQVKKLKEETGKLQIHMDMLDTVNEWRLKEMSENAGIYSFLYGTFFLQLSFLDQDGSDSEAAAEQRLKDIVFVFNLDDEKSQDYARLVHTLLSQFVTGESAWVEKYPTRREVPKLLHDVGLPVSRCRLLGEELRLLKMWGAMRLQILSLTCMDTRVHVVFSCLKAFRKFGVVFSVSLAGLVYHLKVESFQSFIGNTSIQQIEDIVASFTPSRNLLTKICKKIHETLLS